ncbi:MAG TPA: hypothetical protein VFE36_12775, partial [Candidatus Baltobacteraceae bacterium]|nr:hypothetical protein [Candidatus Baltobacteraceae bacterium]
MKIDPPTRFFPSDEVGLNALWKDEPGSDGRGVRIALVDEGIDLLHPAERFARDVNGNVIPKLAAIIPTTRFDGDSEWVQTYSVDAPSGTFEAAGARWNVSKPGSYRFGVLQWTFDPAVNGYDTYAKDERFAVRINAGVLWDPPSGRVWVDTAGKHDFTAIHPLRDYSAAHDVAWFGKIDATGDNRVPFALKIDSQRQAIYVDLAQGEHGGFVDGVLAGNTLSGGLFNGAAPMAQIIDVRHEWTTVAPYVRVFSDPRVDAINCSCGLVETDPIESFRRKVIERLIETYQKPLLCFCAARGAIGVSDYQSAREMQLNHNAPPPYREILNGGGWGGDDDGIANMIYAPSSSLTTQSRYMPYDFPRAGGNNGHSNDVDWRAPAGYTMSANPSPTIPFGTGIVADLIGLARRHHVRYDAFRMANAVFTGSRVLTGFPGSEQINGLIDARNAWRQLQAMNRVDDPSFPTLTRFEVFDAGGRQINGFFEVIAYPKGDVTRSIRIARRGGYAAGRRYRLTVRRGDTGESPTFIPTQAMVTFGRDASVPVEFRVRPTPGDHLEFLQLVDDVSGTVMQHIPLNVIVPNPLNQSAPGVQTFSTAIPPRRWDHRTFVFPNDPLAVFAQIQVPDAGGENTVLYPQFADAGIFPKLVATAPGPAIDPLHHVGAVKEWQALLAPAGGLWWLVWDNRGRAEYENVHASPAPTVPIQAKVTFTEYKVQAVPRAPGVSAASIDFINVLAPLKGRIEFLAGSTTSRQLQTGDDGIARLDVPLPPHAEAVRVKLSGEGGDAAQARAYFVVCDAHRVCKNGANAVFRDGIASLAVSSVPLCCDRDPKTGNGDLRSWSPASETLSLVIVGGRGGTSRFLANTETIQLLTDASEKTFASRAHAEEWTLPMPSLSLGQSLLWALRLAPIDATKGGDGYLTEIHPIPVGTPPM